VLRVKTLIGVVSAVPLVQIDPRSSGSSHPSSLSLRGIVCSYVYFAPIVAAFAGERLILSLFALFPSIISSVSPRLPVSPASLHSRHLCVALIVRVHSRFANECRMPLEKWWANGAMSLTLPAARRSRDDDDAEELQRRRIESSILATAARPDARRLNRNVTHLCCTIVQHRPPSSSIFNSSLIHRISVGYCRTLP